MKAKIIDLEGQALSSENAPEAAYDYNDTEKNFVVTMASAIIIETVSKVGAKASTKVIDNSFNTSFQFLNACKAKGLI